MTNIEEIWKDIPSFEGKYQVSNLGRVKSLSRFIKNSHKTISKEMILNQCIGSGGYLYVNLCNVVNKSYRVHKLVAMVFLNHKPEGYKKVIDHINHDKLNNSVDNLRIVSHRKNISNVNGKSEGRFTSKYTGVSMSRSSKKWAAQIYLNGRVKHIGVYSTEIEAANAYQEALDNYQKNTTFATTT